MLRERTAPPLLSDLRLTCAAIFQEWSGLRERVSDVVAPFAARMTGV